MIKTISEYREAAHCCLNTGDFVKIDPSDLINLLHLVERLRNGPGISVSIDASAREWLANEQTLKARAEKAEAEVGRLNNELRYITEVRQPGTCQCSDDDVCRFAHERDQARSERDDLKAEVARLRKLDTEYPTVTNALHAATQENRILQMEVERLRAELNNRYVIVEEINGKVKP